nr:hypothetical protein [Oxalobacteraceae bacterium]
MKRRQALIPNLSLFTALNMWRPGFAYDRDGSLRTFGIGTKRKTIMPMWLCAIALAMLSYLFVMTLSYW